MDGYRLFVMASKKQISLKTATKIIDWWHSWIETEKKELLKDLLQICDNR